MPKVLANRVRKQLPHQKAEKPDKLGLRKFIKKAPRLQKTKKEKNIYQYVGFFERLKAIDVKVSHASLVDQAFMFDHLQSSQRERQGDDDLSTSNFIAIIKQEKVNNATLEFRRVWKDLEHLAYSFPLVIMNKTKIVNKLLQQLQNNTLKNVYPAIIDLVIALVKDLRQDIYPAFMHEILPVVIGILDCSNLPLLDAVFSLLSFSFKYLLNPLREDLTNFYSVYVELLLHKNKFVRKFAAQSFSYVLRKVKFTPELVKMLCTVTSEHEVLGLVDLLFEVCSGETDALHSKAPEVLIGLLEHTEFVNSAPGLLTIRYLYLKLTNTIDTHKQMSMFEILTEKLQTRAVVIMNDTIKLKFARRVSQDLGRHFLLTLGQLIKSEMSETDQCLVAESLSLLYYFQHHQWKESKLFTHALYQLSAPAVTSFFKILLMKSNEITTESDLPVSKILDLKQGKVAEQFNAEGHKDKCWQMVPSLNKWTLRSLSYERIALLMSVIDKSGQEPQIEIGGKCVQSLISLLEETTDEMPLYLMAKFVSICNDNKRFIATLKLDKKQQNQKLSINCDISQNLVLSSYPSLQVDKLLENAFDLYDMYNVGYQAHIKQVSRAYVDPNSELSPDTAQSIFLLRKVLLKQVKLPKTPEIQQALCKNLSKNSRQLRITTLKVLTMFAPMSYIDAPQDCKLDSETIKQHYTGPCPIIALLLKAEESEISLETEKVKSNLLRKVQMMVHTELVPQYYIDVCYRYAIGCFWVKFSPLYQPAFDLLEEVFTKKVMIQGHLELWEQMAYLMQMGEDNESVIASLQQAIKLPVVVPTSILENLFVQDTSADQDFAQIKDFHYNLTKALYSCIDVIMTDTNLRGQLMRAYANFMEFEYAPLHFGRRKQKQGDFHQTVIASNQMDSQQFKAARRTSYSKLCNIYELFSKTSQLNKLSPIQSVELIDHYMVLLQTADDKLQKTIMQGLLKTSKRQDFENKTIKLPKYQKLLEGLCDEIKFKDMILVITHGSDLDQGEDAQDEDQKKQKQKESIPKLAQDDRIEVLPVIVKLLFSKLLKQKGKINQKSLQTRRTIVYQFLSGLEPKTEFPIFFRELLEPLGLTISTLDLAQIKDQLTLVSFSQFVQFIGSVEVIFAQLGSLLNKDDFLQTLTNILVLMLSQAKQFMGHMKEDDKQDQSESSQMYQHVLKQCKMCVRKGLKIVKHLYTKFAYLPEYATHLSQLCYSELVQDQVQFFGIRYISDRAQLIEIVTTHWSQHCQNNYLKYPEVLPALMDMLKQGAKVESQVFGLHLGMIKNLVVSSIDSDAERLRYINAFKAERDDEMSSSDSEAKDSDQSMESSEEQEPQLTYSEVAKKVISDNITVICEGLHFFWTTHSTRLKQALLGSGKRAQATNVPQSKNAIQERIAMTNAVRDLTFIMSELSSYISSSPNQTEITHSFLDMMVGLISQKPMLHAVSTFQQKSRLEELLMFGLTAITNLLNSETDIKIQERICEFFIQMQSKKARQCLALGLNKCYSTEITSILVDMNTVKKGQADVDYDFDKVLNGIQKIKEAQGDKNVLIFCLLSLMQHTEYSVREYALHALILQLPEMGQQLFRLCETKVISNLKAIRDEMVMKTMLLALRALVTTDKPFKCQTHDLKPLINEEHEDFFTQILSMQLPQRLKALRKLQNSTIQPSTFNRAILPLVDYLIFDMKSQMENRRNTVRYSRDQSNLLQEEALSVYTQYAKKLSWGQYMALVRKMLYKIQKAQTTQNSVAAQKQDSLNEKVICKCLCKVLEGFNFEEVPDAVELLKKTVEAQVHHKYEIVEYSDFLKDMVGTTLDDSEDASDASDRENEDDVVMLEVTDKVEDIQSKLQKKVLPLLQRHILQTKGEHTTIRSFVAVAIAKVIRKLPVAQFTLHLQKLVNLIVVKGLREKDLNTREKARKALIKVIHEVSPRFLTLIIQEMGNNLNRGFQLHVYLYTVHYVFNYVKDKLKAGQVTTQMIKLISPLLLREMFGDLMEERKAAEETAKKHIKESKARKAMPIYEVFAQFIDFKSSFLELIQPIVKVLEENPSHSAIQMTEDLLARIANCVLKNTSITGQRLLPFMRQIIEKGVQMSMRLKINDEKAKRDYGAKPDTDYIQKSKAQQFNETHEIQIKWTKTSQLASDRKTQEICGRVLANFGLQTLKKALNLKGLVLQGDEHDQRASKQISLKGELVQMLDPFVQPLLDSFKTYYNPIVIQTLQIMIHVIHLGLPSFKLLLRKFLNRIFKLFTQNTSADNDFTNSLFKCTSELIRTYSVYNDLSELQIKTLVQIIKSNLQNFSTQTSVFTCLKAILHRRFQCADLYDLITNVQDMMVTSVQQSTRLTCSQIFLTFVLEYPMEEKRLDTHVQHLLKNLTYFDQEGRLQLLETLQILVDKMPEQKLAVWADIIFLTLFLRLVNEPSHKCRGVVTVVLKKLVSKSKKRYVDTIFQMNGESSEALMNGKIQMLTLMAECGKIQKQDIQKTVELLAVIINKAAEKTQKKEVVQQSEDEEIAPEKVKFLKNIGLESSDEAEATEEEPEEQQWSNVYFSMNCLENIFAKCNESKELVLTLQKHPELKPNILLLMWKSPNYWVRLSCQRIVKGILEEASVAGLGIQNPEETLKLTYQLLSVLNFSFVTEALCTQLTHNLDIVLKQINHDDLPKVFKKASYIGRRILGDKSDQTQFKLQALVQFYDRSVTYLISIMQLEQCAGPMLELVYRTYTDDQMDPKVRDPSTELVDKLSESLNKDTFIKIFNQVQMAITQARTDRKIKEKMLVTSEEGIVKMARKRAKKMLKKKDKHKQKVLMNHLTR